jgi:hypothetical protein
MDLLDTTPPSNTNIIHFPTSSNDRISIIHLHFFQLGESKPAMFSGRLFRALGHQFSRDAVASRIGGPSHHCWTKCCVSQVFEPVKDRNPFVRFGAFSMLDVVACLRSPTLLAG